MQEYQVSAPDDSELMQLVEQQLQKPRSIGFAPLLEDRFDQDTSATRCRRARNAAFAGLALYDLFLLVDALLVPDMMLSAAVMRLALVTPMGLAFAWWIGRQPPRRQRAAGQTASGLLACLAAVWLQLSAQGAHAEPYQFAASLVTMYLVLLTTLPFIPAAITSVVPLLAYAAGLAVLRPFAPSAMLGLLAMQSLMVAFGLIANWRMNQSERAAYLLTLRETLRAEELDDQNRELLELSHTDALTGAANRRMFDTELEMAWQGEPGGKVAVLLVDVDHFKAYNDRYGHQAGDRCLAAVSAIMQQQLRQDIDLLARYGGEEFAIILPNADIGDAAMIAERVRRAVEELAIPHEENTAAGVVTISVGFAAAERGPGRPDRLVDSADMALYAAKQGGRNAIAPPLVVSPEKALAHAIAGKKERRG